MRDIALISGFVVMLLWAFKYPHIGALLWCWTALVVPNYYVYGFADPIPFNKIAAAVTLLAWLASSEPKKLSSNSTVVLLVIFGIWGTISALTSVSLSHMVMREWEKFIKILVFFLVIVGLIRSKDRIDALLYTIYFSLGFHGIVEGAKFLASRGSHHIAGPGTSIIGDNNHFALAMIALLPIVLYLYRQCEHRLLKLVLIGSSLLVAVSIMGTFSRGGLLGIAAVGGLAFLRSRKKMRYVIAVVPLIILAIAFAPEKWSSRMDTIKTADQDTSFMGRVIAWKQSTLIAMDNPVFGGGFHAVQDFAVWIDYARVFDRLSFIPTSYPDPVAPHAAHSIYFQVLGDLGFAGLSLFLLILVSAWRNASAVVRATRDREEWHWARDLAISLQYSLVAYAVSGAALSMAYFDYMYMIFAVLVVLRGMVSAPISVKQSPVMTTA
jgi:probable O-glycosylation ligase (exosortase A-associated)